ncbi:MAG: FkbM family methyltransferase [Thaumarchaeota archaeon]|nr:FkbM family methyltransferase [Candidatus Terraquivivens yellowstonensis]
MSTVSTLGLHTALREAVRRVFGINYTWRGVQINSAALFRLLRKLISSGYDVYGVGEEIIVKTHYGEVGVDAQDYNLLNILLEPFEEMYGCVDVNDGVVIDIGAYIGETALYFIHKGARRVYAFEPVEKFYEYLVRNISRNNLVDRIMAFSYGAWFRDATIRTNINGTGTGLRVDYSRPYVELKVRSLKDIFEMVYEREGVIDLVKMNCEGCEYSLLRLDEKLLKLPKQYIIEIHGAELPIIEAMAYNGFKFEKTKMLGDLISVYLFKRE